MLSDLLKQYEVPMPDGYPWAWGHPTLVPGPEGTAATMPAVKDVIRELAGHRCQRCGHPYRKGEHETGEWSPCDERCTHGPPIRYRWRAGENATEWTEEVHVAGGWRKALEGAEVEAHWRILTVHHLDSDKLNCRWWNLVALCQRCHLRMQRTVIMGRPYHYEHSEWFKPYAAGFYAWKYLGEDLTLPEVDARRAELLALEHRFTQEAWC